MDQTIYEATLEQFNSRKKAGSLSQLYEHLERRFKMKLSQNSVMKLERVAYRLPYVHFKHASNLVFPFEFLDSMEQGEKERLLCDLARELSGTIIKPNEVFSFWKNVKNPKKYKESWDNPASLKVRGTNPIISQMTNLIYWMVLHSPMVVVERHRHEFDLYPDAQRVRPFGTGATCVYNLYDLKFQNGTSSVFQLYFEVKKGRLYGELRSLMTPTASYVVYEERSEIQRNLLGEFIRHNVIYRRTENLDFKRDKVDYINENHALIVYDLNGREQIVGEHTT